LKITSDWHIHTHNSCDQASLTLPDLVTGVQALGIEDYGVTDHLHTPYNLPDLEASREEYLASDPGPGFHFGVEVSCMSQWELDEIARGGHENPVYGLRSGGPPGAPLAIGLTEEDIRRLEIEYVIGGAHWPMYVAFEREAIIRDYHRQNMFLAAHPLVDIVAHPWWWMGHWKDDDGRYTSDPWLDDFRKIPQSMHDEFATAVVEHDKIVEINISAILLNGDYPASFPLQYLDYLAALKGRGVRFSIGSDCHSARYDIDFHKPAEMLASIGIKDEDLWQLPPRPAS
jgi:histidinol phosphatase-like PHP family hydrolase